MPDIDGVHPRRPPRQQRAGIAARPEGCVDHRFAGRGRERRDYLVQQHGRMGRLGDHSAIPFSWQWYRQADTIAGATPGVSSSVLGSQISI